MDSTDFTLKARKAAAREERRLARNLRRSQRKAGLPVLPPGVDPEEADEGAGGEALEELEG